MKAFFIQDWGTYPNDTAVCVGLTAKELLAREKKAGAKRDFIDFTREVDPIGGMAEMGWKAISIHKNGWTTLCFKDWKENWEHYETLIHELHHLVTFVLAEDKKMSEEKEALAYQQEYLFREIRRKLTKLSHKKKK